MMKDGYEKLKEKAEQREECTMETTDTWTGRRRAENLKEKKNRSGSAGNVQNDTAACRV